MELPTKKEETDRPPTKPVKHDVNLLVQQRLEACAYRFIFSRVFVEFADGRLTLRGVVPSFYLKQMLQELLRDIDCVQTISKKVDVVSCDGLSSVRPNKPK